MFHPPSPAFRPGRSEADSVPHAPPRRGSAREASTAVVGERAHIELGGKTDARFGGGPLPLEVEIVSISDGRFTGDGLMIHGLKGSFGPSAVLRVGGIEVLVVTIARQMLDLQQFSTFGLLDGRRRGV